VEEEYRALDRAVRRLTPAALRRPAFARARREAWTVKDALAHIVAWKLFTVLSFRREPRPQELRGLEVPEANAKLYREWRRRSSRDVIAAHRAVHREALAALRALPGELFQRPRSPQWPFDLIGHSAEHRRRHIEPQLAPSSAPTSSTRRRTAPRRPERRREPAATGRRARS
jgi:uncharacterized damage-inducible protein DinB